MDFFQRQNGVLHADGVSLETIAAQYGTPTYVYSAATLSRHVQVLKQGVSDFDHILCYAIKANGNIALLEHLRNEGCGFDAVSLGELKRAQKAGATPHQVILSGVGKRNDEIAEALAWGVLYICVESGEELQAVGDIARSMGVQARVSVRVNPDVDAHTHPYISTGLKENKFGVPIENAMEIYRQGQQHGHIQMVGVTCHIGSQITTLAPFEDAATRLATLARSLQNAGMPLKHVGMGGGLGIPYQNETPPNPATYGQALARILGPLGLTLVLEPGRVIVGNAGVLLTRVTRVKTSPSRTFVLLDAGMNDLLRPALYKAHHTLETVAAPRPTTQTVDVVGPVCESSDAFAKNTVLPTLHEGDALVMRSAGAYGFVMASTYNARLRPAEVLCVHGKAHLIRARETYPQLWLGEQHLNGSPVED
jgi:diaminopimelate decarboxylase